MYIHPYDTLIICIYPYMYGMNPCKKNFSGPPHLHNYVQSTDMLSVNSAHPALLTKLLRRSLEMCLCGTFDRYVVFSSY